MTADEILIIVQAYIDGKTIECKNKEMNIYNWRVTNAPTWNFNHLDYRVVREPRTFYGVEYEGKMINTLHLTEPERSSSSQYKTIKLLEVLDD